MEVTVDWVVDLARERPNGARSTAECNPRREESAWVVRERLASAARDRLVVVVQDGHSVSRAQTGEARSVRLRQEFLHSLVGDVVLRDVVSDGR